MQLWGAELWDDAVDTSSNVLTADLLKGLREAIFKRLDCDFYAPWIDSLIPAEQDLLLLTGDCDYRHCGRLTYTRSLRANRAT